jgi:hypothetical protein
MLTVERFKERLGRPNHSDWLHVAVDANNAKQFYILVSGGMGTMLSAPIERYDPAINAYIISMLNSGELVIDEEQNLLHDRNILVHYLSQSLVHKEGS